MVNVVAASNSMVLRMLGLRSCARLGFRRHIAATGVEALALVHELKPQLVILDVAMPELDGDLVCHKIKATPELSSCRVLLVTSGLIGAADLARFSRAGCDDILVLPAFGQEFFSRVAHLLGVPHRRSRRLPIRLSITVDSGAHSWHGQTENLSAEGAMVVLDQDLADDTNVIAVLKDPRTSLPIVIDARVVWASLETRTAGLTFHAMRPDARRALDALVLAEVIQDEDGMLRVYLEGDITDATSFQGLAQRLSGPVDFDAAGVRYINSHGTRKWTDFMAQLGRLEEYTFSRCSVPFATQASLIANFLGRGRVVSLMAPYHCAKCDREESRLLQVAALAVEAGTVVAPQFPCSECSEPMQLDEMPERYFAFLHRS